MLVSVSVGAVLVALVSGPAPAAGQTTVPRTSWGQPDLRGIWDFRTITPFERPVDMAERAFLTEEEAANRERQAIDRNRRLWDRPAELPPVGGSFMTSHTEHLTFNLPVRMGFENITPKVEDIVRRSGVSEGLVLCNAMHITASVFINDDELGLHEDYRSSSGLRASLPSTRLPSGTPTTAPVRTMPTPT